MKKWKMQEIQPSRIYQHFVLFYFIVLYNQNKNIFFELECDPTQSYFFSDFSAWLSKKIVSYQTSTYHRVGVAQGIFVNTKLLFIYFLIDYIISDCIFVCIIFDYRKWNWKSTHIVQLVFQLIADLQTCNS